MMRLPAALIWSGDRPLVTMSEVESADLDAPFVEMALIRGKVQGFVPLDDVPVPDDALRIAGAIHHMTRCGSTLLRRQFDALDRTFAVSEPFAFQHLLEGPAAPAAVTRRRLRQLASLWCDGLAPIADRIVIKWSAVVGQHAAMVAAALPEVPMIFLHRDPVEVLASIEANPLGGHGHIRPHHLATPGDPPPPVPEDRLEASARLIARTCRQAADVSGLRSLDFALLPDATPALLAPYFGFTLSSGQAGAMRTAGTFHSKDSDRRHAYVADSETKRSRASDAVRDLAANIVGPARDALLRRLPPLA